MTLTVHWDGWDILIAQQFVAHSTSFVLPSPWLLPSPSSRLPSLLAFSFFSRLPSLLAFPFISRFPLFSCPPSLLTPSLTVRYAHGDERLPYHHSRTYACPLHLFISFKCYPWLSELSLAVYYTMGIIPPRTLTLSIHTPRLLQM